MWQRGKGLTRKRGEYDAGRRETEVVPKGTITARIENSERRQTKARVGVAVHLLIVIECQLVRAPTGISSTLVLREGY